MASQRPRTWGAPGGISAARLEGLGSGRRHPRAILPSAQTQPAISRAVAQLATTGLLPALSRASLLSVSAQSDTRKQTVDSLVTPL